MKRIDTSTKSANKFGTGKHGFTNGSPGVTPATALTDTWFDHVQEELARAIEADGTALDSSNYGQLAARLLRRQMDAEFRYARHAWLQTVRYSGPGYTSSGGAFTGLAANPAPALSTDYAYYAVGTSAEIRVSLQGQGTWVSGTAGSSYSGDFKGIIYAAGLMIAFGASGEIQTCPAGGNTWTRRKTGGGTINCMAAYGTTLVAGASNGHVWTSSDGITWTDQGVIGAAGSITSIAVGPSNRAVLRQSGGPHYNWASTDGGALWSTVDDIGSTPLAPSVVWVDSLGKFAHSYDDGSQAKIWTSTTGGNGTWTVDTTITMGSGYGPISIAPTVGGLLTLDQQEAGAAFRVYSFDLAGNAWTGGLLVPGSGAIYGIARTHCPSRNESALWAFGHDGTHGVIYQAVWSPLIAG